MDNLKPVYTDSKELADHFICQRCGSKVKRGILNVAQHEYDCHTMKPLTQEEVEQELTRIFKERRADKIFNWIENLNPEQLKLFDQAMKEEAEKYINITKNPK